MDYLHTITIIIAVAFAPVIVSSLLIMPFNRKNCGENETMFSLKSDILQISFTPVVGAIGTVLAFFMFVWGYLVPVYVSKEPFRYYSREVADNIFGFVRNYDRKEKAIKHLSRKDYREFLKYLKLSVKYGEARTEIGDAFYRKGFDKYQQVASKKSSIQKIKVEQKFSAIRFPKASKR